MCSPMPDIPDHDYGDGLDHQVDSVYFGASEHPAEVLESLNPSVLSNAESLVCLQGLNPSVLKYTAGLEELEGN